MSLTERYPCCGDRTCGGADCSVCYGDAVFCSECLRVVDEDATRCHGLLRRVWR